MIQLGYPLSPMKAILSSAASLLIPSEWAYEIKWDGIRAQVHVNGDKRRVFSSNGRDITALFPELIQIHAVATGDSAIFDGEMVIFDGDETKTQNFNLIQRRLGHVNDDKIRALALERPAIFQIFDLLYLGGEDLTTYSYEHRRAMLDEYCSPQAYVAIPQNSTGTHPSELLAQAARAGLEGLVAKNLQSPYISGRSPLWRKLKVRGQQEFVVVGWLPGQGKRSSTFGSLCLGYWHDGVLFYAGQVGTGFSDEVLVELKTELAQLEIPRTSDHAVRNIPNDVWRKIHPVDPVVVVEVAFMEWTPDGMLRHPAYIGRRYDKSANEVVWEAIPRGG